MRLSRIQVLILCGACFCIQLNSAQTLAEYSLDYQASANGITAIASRSFIFQTDSTYRLSNSLEASLAGQLVAKIEQASDFALIQSELKPVAYSLLQTGISQESQAINYNWEALQAISAEDDESWVVDLNENTYDQLSHQFALRQQVVLGEANLEFFVIDEDEIEQHHYQVIAKEIVTTPLGDFSSTKIGRIQDSPSANETTFWLADDWHSVLIRMEQTTNAGLTIVLELSGGVVDGAAIQAIAN